MESDPLDRHKVSSWLSDQGLIDRSAELSIEHISGGSQNIVARITGGERDMILRRPGAVVPDGRNTMMEREFRVLSALEGTTVPHATPIALCTDREVLGATFYLMSEVDGWSPATSIEWPEPFGTYGDSNPRHKLAIELVRTLAELGKVDWEAQGLSDFGRPEKFHDRQVDRWLTHWEGFRYRDIDGLEEAGDWLRSNLPASWKPGLMHGDYSFLNVMFANGPDPQMAAVVDWEMATIGDPLLDLGWLLRQWPRECDPVRTSYVDHTGMPTREEVVELFRRFSGNPLEHLRYYQVLANFKMAIVLEGGLARHLKGELDTPKLATYDATILDCAYQAQSLIEQN